MSRFVVILRFQIWFDVDILSFQKLGKNSINFLVTLVRTIHIFVLTINISLNRPYCGKIGFSPNDLWHVGMKVSGTDLCANINCWCHLTHPNLFLKIERQDDASCWWVCHARFHGILPKEYSGTFYEVPWGLYQEMFTNTQGQSDIVTHQTNIWNKVSTTPKGFFTTVIRFAHMESLTGSWWFIGITLLDWPIFVREYTKYTLWSVESSTYYVSESTVRVIEHSS